MKYTICSLLLIPTFFAGYTLGKQSRQFDKPYMIQTFFASDSMLDICKKDENCMDLDVLDREPYETDTNELKQR